jgi:hypothetical protein
MCAETTDTPNRSFPVPYGGGAVRAWQAFVGKAGRPVQRLRVGFSASSTAKLIAPHVRRDTEDDELLWPCGRLDIEKRYHAPVCHSLLYLIHTLQGLSPVDR